MIDRAELAAYVAGVLRGEPDGLPCTTIARRLGMRDDDVRAVLRADPWFVRTGSTSRARWHLTADGLGRNGTELELRDMLVRRPRSSRRARGRGGRSETAERSARTKHNDGDAAMSERPSGLPPRVQSEIQRILDAAARRLLAERLDGDPLGTAAGDDDGALDHSADEGALLVDGQLLPVTERRDGQRRRGRRA
jgi:hypothetical protein